MKIAIFDYRVTPSNPIGGCHRRMMSALCDEHDFVLVAPEFDNPRPDRILHNLLKVPLRPLALLFITFHLKSRKIWRRYKHGADSRFDIIQAVESNLLGADVIYSQFCHRAYLRRAGGFKARMLTSPRALLRWLDHYLHALLEPAAYQTAQHVVVPSSGLSRELIQEFPVLADKVTVIPNPIDVSDLHPPENFDRIGPRRELGISETDFVLVFTALGHFERKGLPLIFEAMSQLGRKDLKLLVVGGEDSLIKDYTRRAEALGIAAQIVFAGRQKQVRRFLWLSDAFVFPSDYETFSLSSYEAAAAGLPLIVTHLHGVEDFARHRVTAFVIDRTVPALRTAIEEMLALSPADLRNMGQSAREAVLGFTVSRFAEGWRSFYRRAAETRQAAGLGQRS